MLLIFAKEAFVFCFLFPDVGPALRYSASDHIIGVIYYAPQPIITERLPRLQITNGTQYFPARQPRPQPVGDVAARRSLLFFSHLFSANLWITFSTMISFTFSKHLKESPRFVHLPLPCTVRGASLLRGNVIQDPFGYYISSVEEVQNTFHILHGVFPATQRARRACEAWGSEGRGGGEKDVSKRGRMPQWKGRISAYTGEGTRVWLNDASVKTEQGAQSRVTV